MFLASLPWCVIWDPCTQMTRYHFSSISSLSGSRGWRVSTGHLTDAKEPVILETIFNHRCQRVEGIVLMSCVLQKLFRETCNFPAVTPDGFDGKITRRHASKHLSFVISICILHSHVSVDITKNLRWPLFVWCHSSLLFRHQYPLHLLLQETPTLTSSLSPVSTFSDRMIEGDK